MALTQKEKTQIARVIDWLEGRNASDGIDDVLEILHHMIGEVEFSAEATRQQREENMLADMRRTTLQKQAS